VGQTDGEIPGWLDVPLWWRRHRGATTAEKFEGDNQGLDSNTGALASARPQARLGVPLWGFEISPRVPENA